MHTKQIFTLQESSWIIAWSEKAATAIQLNCLPTDNDHYRVYNQPSVIHTILWLKKVLLNQQEINNKSNQSASKKLKTVFKSQSYLHLPVRLWGQLSMRHDYYKVSVKLFRIDEFSTVVPVIVETENFRYNCCKYNKFDCCLFAFSILERIQLVPPTIIIYTNGLTKLRFHLCTRFDLNVLNVICM